MQALWEAQAQGHFCHMYHHGGHVLVDVALVLSLLAPIAWVCILQCVWKHAALLSLQALHPCHREVLAWEGPADSRGKAQDVTPGTNTEMSSARLHQVRPALPHMWCCLGLLPTQFAVFGARGIEGHQAAQNRPRLCWGRLSATLPSMCHRKQPKAWMGGLEEVAQQDAFTLDMLNAQTAGQAGQLLGRQTCQEHAQLLRSTLFAAEGCQLPGGP